MPDDADKQTWKDGAGEAGGDGESDDNDAQLVSIHTAPGVYRRDHARRFDLVP